ncbi:Lrp/AsnC family transcriptional regulator [Micrococcoides hystricis]|uniref:Lrp/AsnC family transcriptional regulator n=1 Tax=Micrococcoides hystricis TaxID=1572761 RepID=A0ABV6P7B4_9MICC
MFTAFVMVRTDSNRIPECAEELVALDGVAEVYSVAGDWDLIVVVRVREHDDLAETIANRISKIEGIEHTQTHMAFRAYSKHDLEATFAIGFD